MRGTMTGIIIPAEHQGSLAKKKKATKKEEATLTVASIKKEMDRARVAKSARIEE